jgi:acyl-CoA synthetase (AMP-forming)/AMP-acid ligase II
MNLAWWLETGAWDCPEKTAIINPDGSEITYAELNRLSNRIGNVLRDRYRVRPDDVVTTLAGETDWHVAIMFGLWKIGAVVCPLNRTQNYPKFVQDIRITRARLLIAEPRFLETAARLLAEREIANAALLGEQSEGVPDFKILIRDAGDQIRTTPRAPSSSRPKIWRKTRS